MQFPFKAGFTEKKIPVNIEFQIRIVIEPRFIEKVKPAIRLKSMKKILLFSSCIVP